MVINDDLGIFMFQYAPHVGRGDTVDVLLEFTQAVSIHAPCGTGRHA